MTRTTLNGKPVHPAVISFARAHRSGTLSRREFLSHATALGMTATGAAALIGTRPARAEGHIQQGGTLRIQMEVHASSEPRLYQWPEMGNQTRGLLEYLVQYNADGSFEPVLLDAWEVNEDATEYRLFLRQGVTWNNGDPFTAADVAANIEGWCDTTVEGSSMPGRMGPLVDPSTGQLVEGALQTPDDHTVILTLPTPDITLIAGLADYPSAIVHRDHIGENHMTPDAIGTGAYRLESYVEGDKSVWVRNPDHTWWNAANGAHLDRIEFIDVGTDPAAVVTAIEDDTVDMVYETVGEFVDIVTGLGFTESAAETAATIVIRGNANAEVEGIRPYSDVRVRNSIAMAIDNAICLEIGYANRGTVAENHHVSPLHPAYAELPPLEGGRKGAVHLMESVGLGPFTHELISLDDGWERDTADAAAAQLRDAGIRVERRVVPGNEYWANWQTYPFSATTWNHRPLATQVLGLAYASGGVWNETGFADEEFDATLAEANALADPDARREKIRRLQEILQEQAVIVQPFWRTIYNHRKEGIVGADIHPQFEIRYQYIGFDG
ncbi:MAG: ABC transporter substrate-binding protein [Pseudomonadota bacterium]